MKFLTFKQDGYETLGIASQDGKTVYALPEIGISYFNMNDLVGRLQVDDWQTLNLFLKNPTGGIPYEDIEKCAPIPCPAQDVICLGENFRAHKKEAADYKKEAFDTEKGYPIYFSKRVGEAVADGGTIPAHADITECMDYEAELAVIIGKEADHVSRENAYNYIFGYTIMNDISARDIQTRHKQWYIGKSLDGFTPMGPWIVTADEIPGRPSLGIRSEVNGELRQDGTTDNFIFDIAYCISELSQGIRLLPGTIISMGTPAGVGMGFNPPRFLKSGDTVTCSIDKIGTLRSTVR